MTWTKFGWPAFPFYFFEFNGLDIEVKKPVDIIPDRFNVIRINDMVNTQIHGLGAPVAASPTRTAPSTPPAKRIAVRIPAAQRSESSSLTPTHGSVEKKSECPKGYYWSYKKKKCLKSQY